MELEMALSEMEKTATENYSRSVRKSTNKKNSGLKTPSSSLGGLHEFSSHFCLWKLRQITVNVLKFRTL